VERGREGMKRVPFPGDKGTERREEAEIRGGSCHR
jgi:hypothetical protein